MLVLFLSLLAMNGCAVQQLWNPPGSQPGTGGPHSESREPAEPAPLAPWDIWDSAVMGDPVFQEADRLSAAGELQTALHMYQEIENHAISNEIRSRALMRRLSTLLKLGRSRQVLDEVAKQLKLQGKSVADSDPTLALYAAYSYVHLGDNPQALVWFSLARKRVNERGVIARRAVTDATRTIMSVPQDTLNKLESGVVNDPFLVGLIKDEQLRRAQGGRAEANPALAWFNPQTYLNGGAATLAASLDRKPGEGGPASQNLPPAGDKVTLGVLLPSSGKYSAHSNLVRQGIDLAVQDAPNSDRIRLVYADTQGDSGAAGSEFDRLVQQEGAALVLGPMLVKDAEEVAKRSDTSGVPFLTFTKRPGITELSRVGFRLGATAENQTQELAVYVVGQLHKKKLAILAPKGDSSGDDFPQAFRQAVSREGGEIVKEATYVPGNAASMKAAVDSLGADAASIDAIFIPDSLERSAAVLENIRNSAFRSVLLLGPAYWNESVAVRGYAPLLENAIIVTPFFRESQRPQVSRFVQAYKAKYNRPPDVLTAQAYDAAALVLAALFKLPEGVPPLELSSALAKQMHELQPQDAVTGRLSVAPNGEISRQMSVLRMQGGDLVEVMAAGEVRAIVSPQDSQRNVITEPRNLPIGGPKIPLSVSKDQ